MTSSFRTGDEIVRALQSTELEARDFFLSLTPDELALRVDDAWTALEQLDHVITAASAVARGFAAPKLLLRLRFGRANAAGRSYEELVADYQARLAAGGRASGRFVPDRRNQSGAEIDARRDDLLARWRRVNARLRNALASWSERHLDRIRFPHPLLGLITARELAYFAIYHPSHHIAATKRRLLRLSGGSPR